MTGLLGQMFHPIGAFHNKNRQITDYGGSQITGLTAKRQLASSRLEGTVSVRNSAALAGAAYSDRASSAHSRIATARNLGNDVMHRSAAFCGYRGNGSMTVVKRIMGASALGMALLLGSSPMSPPAQAGYVMTLKEVGNDVVATGNGPIDLTGLTLSFSDYDFARMDSGQNTIITGSDSNNTSTDNNTDNYTGIGKPNQPFGSGRPTLADSSSGDITGVELAWLVVPLNYISNTPLSGTSTYSNAFDPQCGCSSFDILGVNPGVYVWTWGTGPNQNFTVQVGTVASPGPGPRPVPEPASAALLGVGLAVLLLTRTIRRIQPDA